MTDDFFMKKALLEAATAFEADEVPIGAVIVMNNQIISRGHNMTERLKDPSAHAEMIALTSAYEKLGGKYLPDATLYVTVEPCLMCSGAIYWSQLSRIVWGTDDPKNGHKKWISGSPFHPKATITNGVLAEECRQLMRLFFQRKR